MNDPLASIRCEGTAALIITTEPGTCCRCRATHYFFVCRDGHTLCVKCDADVHPAPTTILKATNHG